MKLRRIKFILQSPIRRIAAIGRPQKEPDSNKSHFEVERKFALKEDEPDKIISRLSALGFEHTSEIFMTDTFLPVLKDGDMMRIREETMKGKTGYIITRKSWVEIDGEREREEEEDFLSAIAKSCLLELGERINGGKLLSFSKQRDHYECKNNSLFTGVVITLDDVQGLGSYSGRYMEIELLVPIGQSVQPARARILELASELLGDKRDSIELSYQQMLIASKS